MCGFGGSVGEGVCANVSLLRARGVSIYRHEVDEIWGLVLTNPPRMVEPPPGRGLTLGSYWSWSVLTIRRNSGVQLAPQNS